MAAANHFDKHKQFDNYELSEEEYIKLGPELVGKDPDSVQWHQDGKHEICEKTSDDGIFCAYSETDANPNPKLSTI